VITAIKDMHRLVTRTPLLTLANAVTLLRLLLLPAIFLLLREESPVAQSMATALAVIGWISDGLDGFAARRLGQVSELGKMLDPLADKIFVIFLLSFLILLRQFPVWVLAIILPRDLLILGCGLYLARRRKTVEKSHLWGKLTTNSLMAVVVTWLCGWYFLFPFLLSLAILLAIISTWSYGRFFFHAVRATSQSDPLERPPMKGQRPSGRVV
jgi:CDP-diacylglycerol--glycerol-3-phosphate 3-phosphatidyltransferase